jgi:hypothetical protein
MLLFCRCASLMASSTSWHVLLQLVDAVTLVQIVLILVVMVVAQQGRP